MKKAIFTVLFLVLSSCLLCACEASTTDITQNPDMLSSHGKLTVYEEEDYKQFVRTRDLPDTFITYDQIKELGSFVYLKTTDVMSGYYNEYFLVDTTGCRASLVMLYPGTSCPEHTGCNNDTVSVPPGHTDMRTIPQEGHGAYTVDGLTYLYMYDDLASIHWIHNGQHFKYGLEPNPYSDVVTTPFFEYPMDADTFAAKLLNAETARAAVDELMASCFPED